jgi:hypothetical protein
VFMYGLFGWEFVITQEEEEEEEEEEVEDDEETVLKTEDIPRKR